jgi:hypothetical protein
MLKNASLLTHITETPPLNRVPHKLLINVKYQCHLIQTKTFMQYFPTCFSEIWLFNIILTYMPELQAKLPPPPISKMTWAEWSDLTSTVYTIKTWGIQWCFILLSNTYVLQEIMSLSSLYNTEFLSSCVQFKENGKYVNYCLLGFDTM